MAQRKPGPTFQSQWKITLALFILWHYLHVAPFDYVVKKGHKKKLFSLLLKKITVLVCYYSIKIHKTNNIHTYLSFPETLL